MRRTYYGYLFLFSVALAVLVFDAVSAMGEPPKVEELPLFIVGGLVFVVWFIASISFTVRWLHDNAGAACRHHLCETASPGMQNKRDELVAYAA